MGKLKYESVKWDLTIIAIFLTNAGRTSGVKKEVFLAIVAIAENGTTYNWAKHVVDLLVENIKNCQDNGASIRFSSLLIWLAMTDVTPVGEAEFTATGHAFMFNFRALSWKNPKSLIDRAKIFFEQWFQNLKLKCGRWRVAQNIRRSLPGSAHVDLQLDHTRVWSKIDGTQDASDLDYVPSTKDIYADLSWQTDHPMQPLMAALSSYDQVSTPLTEAEREEERELTMHIEMFSVAESGSSQVQAEVQAKSTQVEKPALSESGHDNNGSERTLSNPIRSDEEGEDE